MRWKWTTRVAKDLFNVYPIYDWKTEDIWVFHGKNKHLPHNRVYDQMTKAGVKLSQQRLCQPYGDDQNDGRRAVHWKRREPADDQECGDQNGRTDPHR